MARCRASRAPCTVAMEPATFWRSVSSRSVRRFSTAESASFVNGVLDQVAIKLGVKDNVGTPSADEAADDDE